MTRAWVEIDLGALCRNGAAIGARAGVPLLPMVKADGYGTGGVRAAMALESIDPWGFGVADVNEGEALRRAGITRPIVVFTPILRIEIDALRRSDLTPALGDPAVIESWARTARPWHLQIDTGMSRAGMPWHEVAAHRELIDRATPSGAFTHFHSAEVADGSREEQEGRFAEALAALSVRPPMVHAENSAAIQVTSASRYSVVRPGLFLYGSSIAESAAITPEPVVSIRARIVEMRTVEAGGTVSYNATWRAETQSRIATVPLGYADGYRRALGNAAEGLFHGQRVPVVGRVTMDMVMLDVTNTNAGLGDVITLLGTDNGDTITVNHLADWANVSPYEILTGLGQRLPRQYVWDDAGDVV